MYISTYVGGRSADGKDEGMGDRELISVTNDCSVSQSVTVQEYSVCKVCIEAQVSYRGDSKAWLLLGFDGVLHLQPLGPLRYGMDLGVRGGSGGAGLL